MNTSNSNPPSQYHAHDAMSDTTLVLNVEELIALCVGPSGNNVANFNIMKTVLYHLARQMRLLEQDVEIRFHEDEDRMMDQKKKKKHSTETSYSEEKRASSTYPKEKQNVPNSQIIKKQQKRKMPDDIETTDKGGKRTNEKVAKPKKGDIAHVVGDKDKEEIQSNKGQMLHDSSSIDEKHDRSRKEKTVSLTISEISRKGGKGSKDSILIVDKCPTTRDSAARLGRIDVVTRSQFDILKANIDKLMTEKAPKPVPSLPDNKKMRNDLASGSATLPEAMEATELNARIKATEDILTIMADLLTQLVALGAFPPEMSDLLAEFVEEQEELARISAVTEDGSTKTAQEATPSVSQATPSVSQATPSVSQATPEVSQATPSVSQATPLVSQATPLVSQATPSVSQATPSVSHKSVAKDPKSSMAASRMGVSLTGASKAAVSRTGASRPVTSTISKNPTALVTQSEMYAALEEMKNELNKSLGLLTAKSTGVAERARNLAQTIEEQLKETLQMDERVDTLTSITTDYVEQLSGFDSGLTIQLASFHEQMAQMQAELKEGLKNLDSVGKAESSGVLELRNYHEIMDIILKESKTFHRKLVITQEEITEKVKNQLEWLEVLQEDKADRSEVDDGLRDKADSSRIVKFLNENAFEKTRTDLLLRLSMCYDKFKRQDAVWLNALNDLRELANNKADMVHFWELRDNTANDLVQIQADLCKLEIMLGEPKAAMLTRHISNNAHDKTCMVPELVAPCDDSGKPPLDVHTLDYPVGDGPCLKEIRTKPAEDRKVICKRWVGGSHTMLTEYTTREKAQPLQIQITPTKHYCSYGTDGRLYELEEELQPCIECNQLLKKKSRSEVGGGDQGPRDKDLGIFTGKYRI